MDKSGTGSFPLSSFHNGSLPRRAQTAYVLHTILFTDGSRGKTGRRKCRCYKMPAEKVLVNRASFFTIYWHLHLFVYLLYRATQCSRQVAVRNRKTFPGRRLLASQQKLFTYACQKVELPRDREGRMSKSREIKRRAEGFMGQTWQDKLQHKTVGKSVLGSGIFSGIRVVHNVRNGRCASKPILRTTPPRSHSVKNFVRQGTLSVFDGRDEKVGKERWWVKYRTVIRCFKKNALVSIML